ncbi:MAG TPA: iron ABC transporter permease [Clostridia bacterium]|nr:iron ABC transporter permease [Clostridia bacterium]
MIKALKKSHSKGFILVVFILLFIVSFFYSVGNGAVKINLIDIIKIILKRSDSTDYQIIWNLGLPRTIVAALVGICLSLSGVILQGVMRNPLAGPNIIGVSSGGGFLGLVILILFPRHYYLLPVGAFIGALLAALLVYALAWKDGAFPTRLILAGVAVSSLFSAGSNVIMTFFPARVSGVINFMVGGLSAITWKDVGIILPYAISGVVLTVFLPNKLNILMLGDEIATGLGISVERTRFIFIIIASFLAGAAVSVVGLLSFVGLMVPHISRLFVGSDHRYLFPSTIFLGGTVVMTCDTLARILFIPMEIPVGIIMAALGAPFFLYLLRQKERYQ